MNWLLILRRPCRLLLLLLSLSLLAGPALAGADAVVTALHGDACHGDGALKRFDQLAYQQRIALADGAQLVLVDLRSAQQFVLSGPGQFVFDRDGVRQQAGKGSVQRKQLADAYRGIEVGGAATDAGATLRAAEPAAQDWPPLPADQQDERIMPQGATLRWPLRPHSGAWQLRITELDGRVVYQAAVTRNQLLLPPALTLQPDHDYRRELEWRSASGVMQSSAALLRTLSAAQAQQVKALAPAADAPASELLLHALWLRSLGMRSLADTTACPPLSSCSP